MQIVLGRPTHVYLSISPDKIIAKFLLFTAKTKHLGSFLFYFFIAKIIAEKSFSISILNPEDQIYKTSSL